MKNASYMQEFKFKRLRISVESSSSFYWDRGFLLNRQVYSFLFTGTPTSAIVQQLCQWLSCSCEFHKNAVLSWKYCYFVCKTLNIRGLCDKISVISLSCRVERKKNLKIFSRKFKLYLANWQVDITFAVENDRLSVSRSWYTPYYRILLMICGQNDSAKFGLKG